MVDQNLKESAVEHKNSSQLDDGQKKKIVLLVVCSFLLLWVARATVIGMFDSGVTRYACLNHAGELTDDRIAEAKKLESFERESDVPSWSVDGHVRSNKFGLLNRDSGKCLLNPNIEGEEKIWVSISEAQTGSFYGLGKAMGIIIQVGLISGFVRWFIYRFGW